MNHAADPALLLYLHGNDKTLSTDGDQLILHRAAFGEPPQISAQGVLDRALLFFHLAPNTCQLGRRAIIESAIGQDLVMEETKKSSEIRDAGREYRYGLPFHLCGPVNQDNQVPYFQRFQGCASDMSLFQQGCGAEQAGKIKVPATAQELQHFSHKLLLAGYPAMIATWLEFGNPGAAQLR